MFKNMRIGPRLMILIAVQTVLMVAIGATGLSGLQDASGTNRTLNDNIERVLQLENMVKILGTDLYGVANSVNSGAMTWSEGRAALKSVDQVFSGSWDRYVAGLPEIEAEITQDTLGFVLPEVTQAISELSRILEAENAVWLDLFVINDLTPMVNPFLQGLVVNTRDQEQVSKQSLFESVAKTQQFITFTGAIAGVGLLLAVILGFVVYRSIVGPVAQISDTVRKVSAGDFSVRTELGTGDEIGELSRTFDELLEDKVQTLAEAEKENEKLNDSVIQLLTAVSQLSERDLTVRVPVTEDVTGPVADAINQMASETGQVLVDVGRIAGEVQQASDQVSEQSAQVNDVAAAQKGEVERTARELAATASKLVEIAKIAEQCNGIAEGVTTSTMTSVSTVNETLDGMGTIREIIQETGKRIKRLGERSQEIGGIVDIINSVAERTTVLALNASMQAAAAGEAGRGFAVVADEVQRLAENSRGATSQIATLVKNIQVETNDTISSMDKAIAEVVAGSKLAEQAGLQMTETQKTTSDLVDSVRQISENSRTQVRTGKVLLERAKRIQESTRKTGEELTQQLEQTRNLAEFAKQLNDSVQVFRLPS